MPTVPFKEFSPDVSKAVFIAPNAWVTGQVTLGAGVSIFFGAVLRGDIQAIRIGEGTNLQEHAIVHTSQGLNDCIIGSNVTIGHRAILHGCSVRDGSLVGMGSTVLDDAIIEENSMIGANSLITMKMRIPAGTLAVGSPAKVIRDLREDELIFLQHAAKHYRTVGEEYARQFAKTGSAELQFRM